MDLNNKKATRQSFGEALKDLGDKNDNIVVLDADLSGATKSNIFAKAYPDRFINAGIAEQNMVGIAAGLATCGKIAFACSFAVFVTGRVYDQIRTSVCYPNLNVKICGTHSGLTVGEDGATHQMLEDINLMRALPNMKIISPSDDLQAKWAVEEASKIDGPVYIRLCRLATPIIYGNETKFEFGRGVCLGEGKDATIFATGDMVSKALEAKEILKARGKDVRVVDIHTIKPIDEELIIKCAKETDMLISVEDHNIIGGLGSAISDVLTEKYPKKLIKMGVNDSFGHSGKAEEVLKFFHLTPLDVVNKIL